MGGGRFVVSGLVNVETTLRIDAFPLPYCPVAYPFNGISTSISGVGVNVAKALARLGSEVRFCAMLGRDALGELSARDLADHGIGLERVERCLEETPQSVIVYDKGGKRGINVDLKDIQKRVYPGDAFEEALAGADLAALCNINFNRPLLELAAARGVPIATDVHVLQDPQDGYNADYMDAADILFLSDERLWASPERAAEDLMGRYAPSVIVVGLGEKGALLLEKGGKPALFPAVRTRPVVNTIGAGDALFSAFNHFFLRSGDAGASLRRAILFASWKIGEKGAARGFLSETELENLLASMAGPGAE